MRRQHHGLTLAALTIGALAYALLQWMVIPALPAIQEELGTSTGTVTFVLTAYLLSASVAIPISSRLGDMFGKARVLLVTLVLFGIGGLVAALSSSIEMLIAGRVLQGLGGAVFPLSFGIIRDEFPRRRVAAGIGLISAMIGVGGAAGLVLSGVITDNLSYEWIFWLGLAFALAGAASTWLFVPESPVKSPARIDWLGAALLSGGLVALLVAVSQGNEWGWGSARTVGLLLVAAAVLVAWASWERRVAQPMVEIAMMRSRAVLTTNVVAFLIGFGMFSAFILLPRFVQSSPELTGYGFGASVTEAGFFMLPWAVVMLVAGPVSGWLGGRVGSKVPLLVGAAFLAATFAFLALEHEGRWSIYVAGTMLGVGVGFPIAALPNLIVEAVDQTRTAVAIAMNMIIRWIGGVLGGQIAASILSGQTVAGTDLPAESGYTLAFSVGAILAGLAFLAALAIPGRSPRGAASPRRPDPLARMREV